MSTAVWSFRAGFTAFVVSAGACSTVLGIDHDYKEVAPDAAGDSSVTDVSVEQVEQACSDFAAKICAFRKPCCSPDTWKTCEDNERTHCESLIPDLISGARVGDGYALQTCMNKLDKPLLDAGCSLDYAQHVKLQNELIACYKVVTGKVPGGGSCKIDEDCVAFPDPNKVYRCGTVAKLCVPSGALSPDDACLVASLSCGPGQYCAGSSGPVGKCAVASSTKCQGPFECGPGFQCQAGACVPGPGVGSDCPMIKDFACGTAHCTANKCDLWPAVTVEECTGGPSPL